MVARVFTIWLKLLMLSILFQILSHGQCPASIIVLTFYGEQENSLRLSLSRLHRLRFQPKIPVKVDRIMLQSLVALVPIVMVLQAMQGGWGEAQRVDVWYRTGPVLHIQYWQIQYIGRNSGLGPYAFIICFLSALCSCALPVDYSCTLCSSCDC